MKLRIAFLVLFLGVFLVLSGCEDRQEFYLKNATVSQVAKSLKDYAGISGFYITYANEEPDRAAYRVYIGRTSTVVEGQKETTFLKSTYGTKDSDSFGKETYGRVTTQDRPPQKVETDWSIGVQLIQRDGAVLVIGQSSGGFDPGKYFRGFMESLRSEGYRLDKSAS